mmetsp:Transcript_11240/g.31746  ORF Transcript_11240/g.31746 Transcript_11240/m.31746 type:complete len:381 (-) Transcript_11240:2950-4092(-)
MHPCPLRPVVPLPLLPPPRGGHAGGGHAVAVPSPAGTRAGAADPHRQGVAGPRVAQPPPGRPGGGAGARRPHEAEGPGQPGPHGRWQGRHHPGTVRVQNAGRFAAPAAGIPRRPLDRRPARSGRRGRHPPPQPPPRLRPLPRHGLGDARAAQRHLRPRRAGCHPPRRSVGLPPRPFPRHAVPSHAQHRPAQPGVGSGQPLDQLRVERHGLQRRPDDPGGWRRDGIDGVQLRDRPRGGGPDDHRDVHGLHGGDYPVADAVPEGHEPVGERGLGPGGGQSAQLRDRQVLQQRGARGGAVRGAVDGLSAGCSQGAEFVVVAQLWTERHLFRGSHRYYVSDLRRHLGGNCHRGRSGAGERPLVPAEHPSQLHRFGLPRSSTGFD